MIQGWARHREIFLYRTRCTRPNSSCPNSYDHTQLAHKISPTRSMIWDSTALRKVAMHCSPVRAPSHEKRPPLEELHSTVPTTCGPHSSHALATATLSTTSEHMLAFNST